MSLTSRQVKIVEDIITCQRACNDAECPTDELRVAMLDLQTVAYKHGYRPTTGMRCLMDYLCSMLVVEADLLDQQDQINSHLIELGAKQVDLPNESDELQPRSEVEESEDHYDLREAVQHLVNCVGAHDGDMDCPVGCETLADYAQAIADGIREKYPTVGAT